MKDVTGKKVAILVAENFEQVEMTDPRKALDQAGVATYLVSPVEGQVQGVHHDKPGEKFKVDVPLNQAKESEFDALLIPGGVMSPDTLRATPEAVKLVQAFYNVEYLFDVAPSSFNPPPKVMSGVIELKMRNEKLEIKNEEVFFKLVKTAFNQRRKKLRNAVRNLFDENVFSDTIFDKRAEQLSVDDFAALSFKIKI